MTDREQLSHSLRTPLTTIRLVVDVLIRKGEALSAEARRDLLLSALEQSKKLEQAIADVELADTESVAEEESNVIVLHEEPVHKPLG